MSKVTASNTENSTRKQIAVSGAFALVLSLIFSLILGIIWIAPACTILITALALIAET
jgi:hypothetical protein